jgi:photosystem II stability/assembly factor-like uncharacterized protein
VENEDAGIWSRQDSRVLTALTGVAFGAGRFVAVGADTVVTSEDEGVTWQPQSLPVPATLASVAFGNGVFVAVGAKNTILSSADGKTWKKRFDVPGSSESLSAVAFENGTWVVAGNGTYQYFTSPNGTTWTTRQVNGSGGYTLRNVAAGGGLFFSAGGILNDNSVIAKSRDGIIWEWKVFSGPRFPGATGLAYDSGQWVLVGSYGGIATSQLGEEWTVQESSSTGSSYNSFFAVGHGPFGFVAVGVASSGLPLISSSAEGAVWRRADVGRVCLDSILYGVASSESNTVAVGTNGCILLRRP